MKFAAIDIGSNAARLQISSVLYHYNQEISFKKVEYVRFPLRLGLDVFTSKAITPLREANLLKLLHSYKLLMELHDVDDYLMLATSAMREANNGEAIAQKVKEKFGLELQIISGDQESVYVNKAFRRYMDEESYLHIDVGGGSTELTVFTCKQEVVAKSFPIGSIRLLENTVSADTWQDMQHWVETYVRGQFPKITAVGIGGNINKIASLLKSKTKPMAAKDIDSLRRKLESFSLEERINELGLNPDRADVIIPASTIYLSVMKWAKIGKIVAPGLGLKDGIMEALVEKHQYRLNREMSI
ncbi:MAG: Ppx/GppA phosphatase family protein [Thermonemataceae bacterium]